MTISLHRHIIIPYPRLHKGWSYRLLAGAFLCHRDVAKTAKLTIQLYLLMRDPLNSLPTILNSPDLTQAQVQTCLLPVWSPKKSKSPPPFPLFYV